MTTPESIEVLPDIENCEKILALAGKTGWDKERCLGKVIRMYLWAVKFKCSMDLSECNIEAAFQLISDENNDSEKLSKTFKEVGLMENLKLLPIKNFLNIRTKEKTDNKDIISFTNDSLTNDSLTKLSETNRLSVCQSDSQSVRQSDRQTDSQSVKQSDCQSDSQTVLKKKIVVGAVDTVDNSRLTNENNTKTPVDNSKISLDKKQFCIEKERLLSFLTIPETERLTKTIESLFLVSGGSQFHEKVLLEIASRFFTAPAEVKKPMHYCLGIAEKLKKEGFKC